MTPGIRPPNRGYKPSDCEGISTHLQRTAEDSRVLKMPDVTTVKGKREELHNQTEVNYSSCNMLPLTVIVIQQFLDNDSRFQNKTFEKQTRVSC